MNFLPYEKTNVKDEKYPDPRHNKYIKEALFAEE